LFPSAFIAEKWKPHRPLKVGIHKDLIERGLLLPHECGAVFRRYCSRLMYQHALAAGGLRYGLDGEPAGDVTPDEADHAKAAAAKLEAKRVRQAKAITAERTGSRKATKTAKLPAPSKAPGKVQPAPFVKHGKLGLADEKAAARTRREAAHG
jgi:ProP effector